MSNEPDNAVSLGGGLRPVDIVALQVGEDVAIQMKDAEAGVIRVLLLDPVLAMRLAGDLVAAARKALEELRKGAHQE